MFEDGECPFCGSTDVETVYERIGRDNDTAYECNNCQSSELRSERKIAMRTIRDLIEEARENGYRDIADTLDLLNEQSDIIDVAPDELPADDELGLYLRTGIVWAIEYESRGTDDERPRDRETLIQSLHDGGERELADAFDYCWSHADAVTSDDFDPDVLPLDGPELFAFSTGIAFGLARKKAERS